MPCQEAFLIQMFVMSKEKGMGSCCMQLGLACLTTTSVVWQSATLPTLCAYIQNGCIQNGWKEAHM